jgi:hypothetical protein
MKKYNIKMDGSPPPGKAGGHEWKLYPFSDMPVGSNFQIGVDKAEIQRVRVAACHYARRHSKKFSVQRDPKSKKWRCYRVQ